jgi:hypothetical protein
MSEPPVTLDEWRGLYQAAMRIKEIAPWEWMAETEIFGVSNPETGELGFVSVMGEMGEHLGLAAYLGPQALYHFWALQDEDLHLPMETILEVPQLQASFEDRRVLTDRDLRVIKDLGLKFRGRQAWPQFRSYRPGFHPWYLEPQEARFLTHVLEQAADVVLRLKDNPDLLTPPHEESYLVRVSRREGEQLIWDDVTMNVPPPEPEPTIIEISSAQLAHAKRLPISHTRLEADLFPLLSAYIAEKPSERPQFAYILLCLDCSTGMVLNPQILSPIPSVNAMRAAVPGKLLIEFIRQGKLPAQINVVHPDLYRVIEPVARELKIRVSLVSQLPMLEDAKEYILSRFQ